VSAAHSVPVALRPLVAVVRRLALTCPLTVAFRPLRGTTAAGAALRGQCVNASALFHLLAGGSASGWRMMRIGGDVWKHGPHYFVEHDLGTIVDPTADQFPPTVRIPYEIAKGQTDGSFRKVPAGTRLGGFNVGGMTASSKALRAAMGADGRPLAEAMWKARDWSRR
jgi:hypothetical protein